MTEAPLDEKGISGNEIEIEQQVTGSTPSVSPVKKRFQENEDVLSRWNDGLLYLGTIIKVDEINEKCLVRFEDNSEHWAMFKDLQKGVSQDSDIVCSLCENGVSEAPNEIVICDNCSFGFHQLCHNPDIPSEVLQPEVPWLCRQCAIVMVTKKGNVKKNKTGMQNPKSFPYELNSLTWDGHHKSNAQQCYCYCGGPGDSSMKMLQCYKCKQWFHEACIQSLEMPLLCGDRFYIFVCSVCNSGAEYLRRLDLKWADVVHLVIYNLTLNHNKKYFDLETVIIPFINDNWELLQVPKNMVDVSEDDRFTFVHDALLNYKSRFKCGREIKKKNSIWGLRVRVPPAPPKMFSPLHELDAGQAFNDVKSIEEKKEAETERKPLSLTKMRKRRREADLLLESAPLSTPKKENCLQSLMIREIPRGRRKGSAKGRPKKGRPKKIFQNPIKTGHLGKNNYSEVSKKMQSALQDSSSRNKSIRNTNANTNQNCKGYPRSTNNYPVFYDSSDDEDASSHGTLDSIIPPPTNFEGHNHPFRNLDLLPLSVSVLRPSKRKLNSNDIRISKKGEIKQRRYRRRRMETSSATNSFSTNTSRCGQTSDITRLILNGQLSEGSVDTSTSEFDCVSSDALQMKSIHSPNISLNDLKSSVNTYFGAATRIASGEKFNVLARRITPEARVQYLIEWEGLTA